MKKMGGVILEKKVFWFDVETTGLDPLKQDIIQLAFLIEIKGKVIESHNLLMQPFNYSTIDQEAIEIHNRTINEIKKYPAPNEAYCKLIAILEKYVDRYDRTDKFYHAGYNTRFDMDFLRHFFIKNGDNFFGSWFNYKGIDPLPILHLLDGIGTFSLVNYKLETVCKHFDIPLNAHDALSDVYATRNLTNLICSKYIKKLEADGKLLKEDV